MGLKDLPAGQYVARWLDCLTGHEIVLDDEHRPAGDPWHKPEAFGDEVVLYLQKHTTV